MFIVLETNTFGTEWGRTLLVMETNAFYIGEEHFSAGNECVENTCLNYGHTNTSSYQQLSNRPCVEMITVDWEIFAVKKFSAVTFNNEN